MWTKLTVYWAQRIILPVLQTINDMLEEADIIKEADEPEEDLRRKIACSLL